MGTPDFFFFLIQQISPGCSLLGAGIKQVSQRGRPPGTATDVIPEGHTCVLCTCTFNCLPTISLSSKCVLVLIPAGDTDDTDKSHIRSSLAALWLKDPDCYCYGAGSIPSPETSMCWGCNQKKKKKVGLSRRALPVGETRTVELRGDKIAEPPAPRQPLPPPCSAW